MAVNLTKEELKQYDGKNGHKGVCRNRWDDL